MREIFIPENRRELESLVGKLVGLNDNDKIFSIDVYSYFRVYNKVHEFIRQKQNFNDYTNRFYPSNNIHGILINDENLDFTDSGVVVELRLHTIYNKQDRDYRERLEFLKEHYLWEDPEINEK